MFKRMMNYVFLILGALVVLSLWLRWYEPRMIYYPSRQIALTPKQAGLNYEDVTLTTDDDVSIHGWFLPADNGYAPRSDQGAPDQIKLTLDAPTLTLLFFHGNAGNISHRFEKFAIFQSLGVDVFIIDYRGYGRSGGKPTEPGTYLDSQAAYEYLTTQRGLDPRTIVLHGVSLGAGIAVDLASRVEVGGVVLEEAFTSIADVGQKMFPFLPVRWLVRNKYDSLSKINRINAQLLIIHSCDDEYFSIRHAERLLKAAQPPKQLVKLRGGHNDAFLVSAETYRQGLKQFLDNLRATPLDG